MGAIPALIDVVALVHQFTPSAEDLYPVAAQVIAYHLEAVVSPVAVGREGIGDVEGGFAVLQLYPEVLPVAPAWVAHFYPVRAHLPGSKGRRSTAVAPQIGGAISRYIVEHRPEEAHGRIVYLHRRWVDHRYADCIAYCTTGSGHLHPVATRLADRQGAVGTACTPEVGGRKALRRIQQHALTTAEQGIGKAQVHLGYRQYLHRIAHGRNAVAIVPELHLHIVGAMLRILNHGVKLRAVV
ncbi:hypothetical protein [Thermaurantimonas aggregans]|uniref:hypothetical protein n=1 Tax=Thermaurantimonas aggregans TaxID=2173829 RepID=UPI0023F33A17|nr:hypothetical protein [Thermaurantimonas aggregans]MCX8149852.1 hypothetical protein [Thermaurantimonas aggregans]